MTSNQDTITAFLRGKGFTAAQIAGVEGNLQTESNFSPTASNPREGAIGIAQWENGRRTALQSFARSNGGSETDLMTQLNFMWSELQGSEHSAFTALVAATTPAAAATAFDQKYERSSPASLPARVANANKIAASGLTGGTGVSDTGLTIPLPFIPGGGSGVTIPAPGDAVSGVAGAVTSGITAALAPLGKWIIDGFLIVTGAVLIVVALVLIAKESGHELAVPGTGGASGGGGKAAGTAAKERHMATEAAEVAA